MADPSVLERQLLIEQQKVSDAQRAYAHAAARTVELEKALETMNAKFVQAQSNLEQFERRAAQRHRAVAKRER